MREYLRNVWIRIGLVLVVLGSGPLLLVGFLSTIGIGDPNPNPIGLGLLFVVTAWPAVICLLVGIMKVRDARKEQARARPPSAAGVRIIATRSWLERPGVRIVTGLAGLALLIYGIVALLDGQGRGAAAAMVIGVAVIHTGIAGKFPDWFRR